MTLETQSYTEYDENLQLEKLSIADLRTLRGIEDGINFITSDDNRKIQTYNIEMPELQAMQAVLKFGIPAELLTFDNFQLEIVDNKNELLIMHVNPEFIWERTGCFFDNTLVNWSVGKSDEILDVVFSALSPILEYFDWNIRGVSPSQRRKWNSDCSLSLCNKDTLKQYVVVELKGNELGNLEKQLRRYSVDYHRNCIWLGRKIKFKAKCFMELIKSNYYIDELKEINVGDLFGLQQTWLDADTVQISSTIVCSGRRSKQWIRKIFLKIDTKDALMEFHEEDWKEDREVDQDLTNDEGQSEHQFTVGEQGPDAVHLNILIGTTILSFNDLCNIQPGSLIEIKESLLPMVRFNIGEETIFEGELVRLNDQLMVQVTKKVD